ncbi:MAG: hypothetical protein ACE5NA_10970 [Nitrospiraceae bacterium]
MNSQQEFDLWKGRYTAAFKRLRDAGNTEALEALKLGYTMGELEAYWDWRNKILAWFDRGMIVEGVRDALFDQLDRWKAKPNPRA